MLTDLTWALSAFRERVPGLEPGTTTTRADLHRLFLDYYEGRHKLTFATQRFLDTFGETFQAMSENLCPIVVDCLADLLQVAGFTARNGSKAFKTKVAKETAEIERRNRMDRRRGEILRDLFIFGENYVIVWPDPDDPAWPTIYPNTPGSVVVKYHPQKIGLIERAAKFWIEDLGGRNYCRLNLYYPDRIEKYVSTLPVTALPEREQQFGRFLDADDPRWPLPNPYGKVPVFAYSNNAGVGKPGQSELRDVIKPQNGLNKSLCDLLVAMEFEAFAQRWATGLEIEADDEGNPKMPFKAGIDRLWGVLSDKTTFGEFSRADIEKFVVVQNSFRASIARIGGFPLHMFMLDTAAPPSGTSLVVASARLTSKAKDRKKSISTTDEDIMRFCLQIRGMKDVDVQQLWDDLDPKEGEGIVWDVATKKVAIVGTRQTLREQGYSEEQIDAILQEKLDEEFGDGAPAPSEEPASDAEPEDIPPKADEEADDGE